MKIYLDTEFTDLTDESGPIRLISAGFVAQNDSEFYFELTDNYQHDDCSYFVLEHVLPHLNHDRHGTLSTEAALKLKAWCEGFGEPVQFASDAPAYDFDLIALLLHDQKIKIDNLDVKCLQLDAYMVEDKIERYYEYQPMAIRHHALWDARALASVFGKNYG